MALVRVVFAWCLLLVSMLSPPANAQQQTTDWTWGLEVYGWLPDIKSTLGDGTEIEISQTDILDSLEFTLQGNIYSTRGNWTVFADSVLLQLGSDDTNSSSRPFAARTSTIEKRLSDEVSFSKRVGLAQIDVKANAEFDLNSDAGIDLETLSTVSADVRLRSAVNAFGAGYTFVQNEKTTLTAIGGITPAMKLKMAA